MQPEYTKTLKKEPPPVYQLTVITVCWNALADLKPTVASVLRQKIKGSISIEHVVVDGASTDGTPEWLAEQLAAGNIERYVSEPDRGIYDAMNKGINLARGEVLAFLNAGDYYLDAADIAECVLPLCRGEAESCAAAAVSDRGSGPFPKPPRYDQLYFYTPCCHQTFFATAAAYRAIGGYEAESFRCYADAGAMYKILERYGMPIEKRTEVAFFDASGFSCDCSENFRDELVELLWRNRRGIAEHCRRDNQFLRVMEAYAAELTRQFSGWEKRHGRPMKDTLSKLAELCRMLSAQAHSRYAKWALRALAGICLPGLAKKGEFSGATKRVWRLASHAFPIPGGNAYAKYVNPGFKPLRRAWPFGAIRALLHR